MQANFTLDREVNLALVLITKTCLFPKTIEHVMTIMIKTAKVVGKPKNTDNIRPIAI
jgi:hypothetical protein